MELYFSIKPSKSVFRFKITQSIVFSLNTGKIKIANNITTKYDEMLQFLSKLSN